MIEAISKLEGALLVLNKERLILEDFVSIRLTDRQKDLLLKREQRLCDFHTLASIRCVTKDRDVMEKWLELSIKHQDILGLNKALSFLKTGKI
jgi:hypothetical protein